MKVEIWKDIPGYEGLYQVSNIGRVRSFDRMVSFLVRNTYPAKRIWKGKILKNQIKKDGYVKIGLYKDKKMKYFTVHRLVAITFLGYCSEDYQVCHNNGDPSDNRVENLRWDTASNNQLDRIKHGTCTYNRGEKSPTSKLITNEVKEIKKLLKTNITQKNIAKIFGISQQHVSDIKNNKRWSHLETEIKEECS